MGIYRVLETTPAMGIPVDENGQPLETEGYPMILGSLAGSLRDAVAAPDRGPPDADQPRIAETGKGGRCERIPDYRAPVEAPAAQFVSPVRPIIFIIVQGVSHPHPTHPDSFFPHRDRMVTTFAASVTVICWPLASYS